MFKAEIIINYLLPIVFDVIDVVALILNKIAIYIGGFVVLIPIVLNFISKRK